MAEPRRPMIQVEQAREELKRDEITPSRLSQEYKKYQDKVQSNMKKYYVTSNTQNGKF